MKQPVFITGIGTGIGKTIISAIVAEALEADYWKPVQAGFDTNTDSETVSGLLSNNRSIVHPELYKLALAASPHIAARAEGLTIDTGFIADGFDKLETSSNYIVTEGAGGLMVPLNDHEFIPDLIKKMQAKVILVSRNYLGSINHSLLTAAVCKQYNLNVAGWIFNDHYMDYEAEIAAWSGYPHIGTVSLAGKTDRAFVQHEAGKIRNLLVAAL